MCARLAVVTGKAVTFLVHRWGFYWSWIWKSMDERDEILMSFGVLIFLENLEEEGGWLFCYKKEKIN